MGLDTSHDAFHGAYSAFNRLRTFALRSIGGSWPPHPQEWDLPGSEAQMWLIPRDFSPEAHPGIWEFFNHSDCDGEIDPEMCAKVADDLETYVLPRMLDINGHGHLGGYRDAMERFIAGCRLAHERGEPLIFA